MAVALVRRLLRLSTHCKIFLANSIIVVVGAVVCSQITVCHAVADPRVFHWDLRLVLSLALGGVLVTMLVNFATVRAALHPLNTLHDVARRVQAGDLAARVPPLVVSDARFDALAAAVNEMIGKVEHDQSQLQEMSWQVLRAQEEERGRIARELHDETAQSLTSLLVRLRLLSRAKTPEEMAAGVAELRQLTANTLEEVRRLALELRPSVLDDLGLVTALGWHVDECNSHGPTRIQFHAQGVDRRFCPEVELALYRVTQEALTNVARHSAAANAWVELSCEDGGVALTVRDDGRGFDVPDVLARPRRGLGLFGMRERMSLLGGEFAVRSAPGGPTTVCAQVHV